MRKIVATLMVVFLCLVGGSVGFSTPEDVEILVKFESEYDVQEFAENHGLLYQETIPGIDVHVFRAPEMVRTLSLDPGVTYVEVNGQYEIQTPDDFFFDFQHSLPQIQAVDGWAYGTGCESIVIAILDTGICSTHEDVAAKVVLYENFTDSCTEYDRHGHGTHVAGIASAITNNYIGIAGVSWDSSLMSVKVMGDDGRGDHSWIAEGIVYAVDHGADVINMSFGGGRYSNTMKEAIVYAHDAGVVLVGAAGNYTREIVYPARYKQVIAVGAVNQQDVRAVWSAIGPELDVVAPGVSILSTTPGNRYAEKSGTSMATPMVAGLVGLILSVDPELHPEEVRTIIIKGADDLGWAGHTWQYGHGRIDVYESLAITPPKLPEELSNQIIVKDTGVSIKLLFKNPESARAKINEALSGTQISDVWVNFTDSRQVFNLFTRKAPTIAEVEYIIENLNGYWNEEGEWVAW